MNRLARLIFKGYERVQNTGSTARDHLANERTYLAWTRTSLGLIALGIGVERFERFRADMQVQAQARDGASPSPESQAEHERQIQRGRQLAGTLLATGVATLVAGTWRYYATLRDLQAGVFRPNVHGVALVTVGCACVTAAVVRSEWRNGAVSCLVWPVLSWLTDMFSTAQGFVAPGMRAQRCRAVIIPRIFCVYGILLLALCPVASQHVLL